jgi:hypothetical protein
VHADGDGQVTVFKKANCAPPGVGVRWRRHRLPFQRSASVPAFEVPAAVHAEGDVQATLARKPPPCSGLGVGWMRHRLPFHRSARVLALGVKALEAPTAMQDEADMHATPDRTPPPRLGSGVGWMRHRLPFQRSATVPAFEFPTAVHAEGDVHATPFSMPPPWAGLGVGWMRHRLPSHRSASGWEAPARLTMAPTAVHADGAVQETPNRELTAAPRGLGVGRIRHVLPFHRSASGTPTPDALT